jgi:hypothetical protein
MRSLRSFYRRSGHEKRLVLTAFILLALVRAGLWSLSFLQIRRMLQRVSPRSSLRGDTRSEVGRLSWAVSTASRFIPRATCLVQALALQTMLRQHGIESSLNIGVAKQDGDRLNAHAWIQHGDELIACGSDPVDYTPLLVLQTETV